MTQDDIMLPQIDGFNCGIHSILNTHYLLFLKTDEDDTVSDYCYEILTLKVFEHKQKKISGSVKDSEAATQRSS